MWYDAASNSWTGPGSEKHSQFYGVEGGGGGNSYGDNASTVLAFTGTATGNKYNVGQWYNMGGVAYRANADGSFTNAQTGNTIAGSAGSSEATFFVAQTLTSSAGGSGPASATVVTDSEGKYVGTTGPGAAAVTERAPVDWSKVHREVTQPGPSGPAITQGPGAGKVTTNGPKSGGTGAASSGVVPGWSKPKDQMLGPRRVTTDQSFPDVEDFWEPRYGELGEWLGGGVNVIADVASSDRSGALDEGVRNVLKDTVKVQPGGVADHVLRFGDSFFNGPATKGGSPITDGNPMMPHNAYVTGGGF